MDSERHLTIRIVIGAVALVLMSFIAKECVNSSGGYQAGSTVAFKLDSMRIVNGCK